MKNANYPDQNEFAGYHPFTNNEGEEHGSFRVFWSDPTLDHMTPRGWYWIAESPGCMPDGEVPIGPFATSHDAFENARED